jgi:hypothetical protein
MTPANTTGTQQKLDLRKSLGVLYKPRGAECVLVHPPPLPVLAIEGAGDPNTSAAWRAAVEALYSVAYTLKFMLKKRGATPDYGVMPLEALWWVADGDEFNLDDKRNWLWRALIVQPDFVRAGDVDAALMLARKKKALTSFDDLYFTMFDEGPSAQVLHTGPYADEPPTVARLVAFIAQQGFVQAGKHHEIYLSDPQRSAPEKMRTIIRLPIGQTESHV